MTKKKTLWVPYDSIEICAIEDWLTEQAKKGWQLKAFHGSFAVFEQSAPCATRYCLDALSAEKYATEQELREAAVAQGWAYVSDFAWHRYGVYRSDDPGAMAFHSDLTVRRTAMHGRFVFATVSLVLLALLIVYQVIRPNGLIAVLRGATGPQMYLGNGLLAVVSTVLLFLVWGGFALTYLGALRRAKRDLEQGFAGPRPSATRCTLRYLFLVVCVLAVVALLFVGKRYETERFASLPEQSSLRVPLWQTLDAEEYDAAQMGRPDEPALDDFLVLRRSPFAVEICSVRQNGNYHAVNENNGVMDTFYDADLCVMKSERYAVRVFELLAQQDACVLRTPSDGFDAVAWGEQNGAQSLVLRKDNTVIWVVYNGGVNLREEIHVFADALQQGETL